MYRLSPSWRIVERDDGFEIYGGDDARFQFDPSPLVSRLAAGDAVTRDDLDPTGAIEFEQLLSAGMIRPEIPEERRRSVAVVGDPLPIDVVLPGEPRSAETADLLVLVRHTATAPDIVRRASKLERPHLFVDMSFHHTVSIGPLVIPYETPCVTCLQGRLRERWGEREPVADPEVTRRYPDLVAALLASEVRRCLEGDTSLVGWTVAWNLADRSILREKLLTVPLCDYCRGIDLPGSITP